MLASNPATCSTMPSPSWAHKGGPAKLTKDALLRNLDIAEKLGCLNSAGLGEMKRGKAPKVMTKATSFPWTTSFRVRSCRTGQRDRQPGNDAASNSISSRPRAAIICYLDRHDMGEIPKAIRLLKRVTVASRIGDGQRR
jgi:hypothetical protein